MFGLPIYAACPLGGACAPTDSGQNTLFENRFVPDNQGNLQQPNNLQNTIINPYNNQDFNSNNIQDKNFSQRQFERDCQFGVCLP